MWKLESEEGDGSRWQHVFRKRTSDPIERNDGGGNSLFSCNDTAPTSSRNLKHVRISLHAKLHFSRKKTLKCLYDNVSNPTIPVGVDALVRVQCGFLPFEMLLYYKCFVL